MDKTFRKIAPFQRNIKLLIIRRHHICIMGLFSNKTVQYWCLSSWMENID